MANPSGTDLVQMDGSNLGNLTLDSNGNASITITCPAPGGHTLNANYGGDPTHLGSIGTLSFTSSDPVLNTTSMVSINPTNPVAGQQMTVSVSVQNA